MINSTLRFFDVGMSISFNRSHIYRSTLYLFATRYRLLPLQLDDLDRSFRKSLFLRWGYRRYKIRYHPRYLMRIVILSLNASTEINFDPRRLDQDFRVRLATFIDKIRSDLLIDGRVLRSRLVRYLSNSI